MKIAAVLLALLSGDVGDAAKKDRELMEGTWVVSACHNGKQEVTSPSGDYLVTFEKGVMWVTRNGQKAASGVNLTLDTTKSPRTMDLKTEQGDYLGIYEIAGDRLQIFFSNGSRPTRFDAR